jgi:transposase-like protein
MTTTMTVERFRQAVSDRRGTRRHGAPRYPDELVAFAVEYTRTAQAAGRRLGAIAAELGVCSTTLGVWTSRATDSSAVVPRLRKVVVSEEPPKVLPPAAATGVELTTAAGHVVRGLSIEEVAALLRALS